jgi:hypothetical protein
MVCQVTPPAPPWRRRPAAALGPSAFGAAPRFGVIGLDGPKGRLVGILYGHRAPAGGSYAADGGVSLMPKEDVTRRRHVLLVDVIQAAGEVSRLVHEARDLNLPIEPGVRNSRDTLVRGAVLLNEVTP